MFGLGKRKQVAEHEAEGEVERVYHEIKQVLRVTGVNLNFRSWAGYKDFFPAMWDAVRPMAETRIFEDAADRVRSEAAYAAQLLSRLDVASAVQLGESQVFQIRAALDLYHYVNPKLLILTSAIKLALGGTSIDGLVGAGIVGELIERGAPARMYPMEMESEDPDDERLKSLFEDIKSTLSLLSVNSDYRTLALWPDYLAVAWERLKPITQRADFVEASDRLRESARSLAQGLPQSKLLTKEKVDELGEDSDEISRITDQFERLLPGLILSIALLENDWRFGEELACSPFPALARQLPNGDAT